MAWQGNRSSHHNAPWSENTWNQRFLPRCLLYLHIIRNSRRSIGVMKYIPMWMNYFFVRASSILHQLNVNRSGSNMQPSQTLRATSPVLPSTSRCSQTALELRNVLSDSARAFSCAPESTCSYGGAFSMLRDLTYRIVKFWSCWDLCADLRETSRAAETAAQHCGRLGAVFSQQWFLHNHKAFRLIIFIFVTVRRFTTS